MLKYADSSALWKKVFLSVKIKSIEHRLCVFCFLHLTCEWYRIYLLCSVWLKCRCYASGLVSKQQFCMGALMHLRAMQARRSDTMCGCDCSEEILVGAPSTGQLPLMHWSRGCKAQHYQSVCASAPSWENKDCFFLPLDCVASKCVRLCRSKVLSNFTLKIFLNFLFFCRFIKFPQNLLSWWHQVLLFTRQ